MNINTSKQMLKLKERYDEALVKAIKLEIMPTPGISDINYKVRREEEQTQEENEKEANQILIQNQNNKGFISQMNSHVPRDIMLTMNEYYGSYSGFSKEKPTARCQTTCTALGVQNSVILVGGLNSDRLIDFWILENKTFSWRRLQLGGEKILARMGHTAVYNRNMIYIYGGSTEPEPEMPRDDISIINLDKMTLSTVLCQNKKDAPWRRNHISESIGNHMFTYGGINDEGEFLNDSLLLELNSLTWHKIEPKQTNYKPMPCAFHCSTLAVTSDKRYHSHTLIYKFPDLPRNRLNNIKYEGIYIFGGLNPEGECNNDLRLVKVGKRPLEWIKPETNGQPPGPRYSASMSFYEQMEILIVHGGRNDKTNKEKIVYNDIYIFDLFRLTWIQIKVFGREPQPRSEHISTVIFNKLIIFGGRNSSCYLGSDLYIITLDYFVNRKRKEEHDYQIQMKKDVEEMKKKIIAEKKKLSSPRKKTLKSPMIKRESLFTISPDVKNSIRVTNRRMSMLPPYTTI